MRLCQFKWTLLKTEKTSLCGSGIICTIKNIALIVLKCNYYVTNFLCPLEEKLTAFFHIEVIALNHECTFLHWLLYIEPALCNTALVSKTFRKLSCMIAFKTSVFSFLQTLACAPTLLSLLHTEPWKNIRSHIICSCIGNANRKLEGIVGKDSKMQVYAF